MMKDSFTKALIYESQGLFLDAGRIYKEILKIDPNDEKAKSGLKRALQNLKTPKKDDMLTLFLSEEKDDILKFKRWLVEI